MPSTANMIRRMPSAFAGALSGSALTAGGVWNLDSSTRLWPSGVRIMAMSARTSSSPTTRPAQSPSTCVSPSSSRHRARPAYRRQRAVILPAMRASLIAFVLLCVMPATAFGHAERATHYPDHDAGHVPTPRSSGPSLVVCKPDSARLIRQDFKGHGPKRTRQRRQSLRVLKRCRFRHIQAAVNAAKSNYRILVMPGTYREEPSRAIPVKDPRCAGDEYWESSGDNHQPDARVPTYLHQVACPNARNLVAIIGDSVADDDRVCDQRCNLQIQGMGRRARDTALEGDRLKPDGLRADRADGFQLSNMTVEQGAYNDINVVETNGFRLSKLVARWASHYGVLTFTTDNGLYDNIEAYGSGDS